MSEIPYMQLYIADYLGDTRHLTTEQHGAYLLLLMTMWRAGGHLPNDPSKLARICGVTLKRWKHIATEVMKFFDLDGDEISQKRLTSELQKAVSISRKRILAGRKGGEAKALKNNDAPLANGIVLPEHHAHVPEPEPYKIEGSNDPSMSVPTEPTTAKSKRTRAAYPADFEEFWRIYPTDPNMSKKEAYAVWRRISPEQRRKAIQAVPAFREYCRKNPDYRPVHACRFLSKERADGFLEARQQAGSHGGSLDAAGRPPSHPMYGCGPKSAAA